MKSTVETILLIAVIGIIAVMSANAGRWDLVNAIATGCFAILTPFINSMVNSYKERRAEPPTEVQP